MTTAPRNPALAAVPLLWAAFAVLMAVTLYILLQACGLVLPGYRTWHRIGFDYCAARDPSPARADAERIDLLRDLARQLELQVVQRQAACLAELPPAAPQARRLAERPPSARPGPPGRELAERAETQPTPGHDPTFPENKWSRRDLSVLNGCWQLGREVRRPASARQDNPDLCLVIKALRLCLDSAGSGQAEARGEDCPELGTTSCQAPVTAAFAEDGTLRLTTTPTQCPNEGNWPKTVFGCRRAGDQGVVCNEPNGGGELELRR